MPRYLRPTAAIQPDALLPGDPGRALALAQDLLEEPKMSNHARGLWGYCGQTAEGRELTIQSTGIGGPSAAIVLSELAELGVRRAVRIGTCRALDPGLVPGDLVAVGEAIGADGVSRELGAQGAVPPDPQLGGAIVSALVRTGGRSVRAASADLDGPQLRSTAIDWAAEDAAVIDLATAPLLALGPRLGVATASLLIVAERHGDKGEGIEDERLAEAALRAGHAAVAALQAGV